MFVIYAAVLIAFILLISSFFTVKQQTVCLIERFGKFVRTAYPGLHMRLPLIETIRGTINLRITQIDVEIETKTKDDVFVHMTTSVQYQVLQDKIYESFYTLDNVERQIQAFVFDVVRAHVPKIKLDDVFSKKDEIADNVREELQDMMNRFGYNIIKALVTDINPDAKVKAAMNEINEAQRLRVAAMERGEAEKILRVKHAEAEAESKILQGQGMAGQRKAIIDGLRDSLTDFKSQIPGSDTHDVMSLILMAQYFDTLKEMAAMGKMNTILIPHSPSSLHDVYDQIRTSIISANQVEKV